MIIVTNMTIITKRDQVTIVPIVSFIRILVLSEEINLSENLLGKGLERPRLVS